MNLERLKNVNLLMFVIMAVCFVSFIYNIGHEDIWNDEWFSVNSITKPDISSVCDEIIFSENTPPAYFLLLRWWSGNGSKIDLWYLRLFSALLAVTAVWLIFKLASLVADRKTGLIASVIFGLSPYLLWYAQEARNSTMEVLLSLLIMYFFLKFTLTGKKSSLIWWGVFQFIGIFTHYFLILLIPAQFVYIYLVWDKSNREKWWIIILILFLGFCFWIPSMIEQIRMGRTAWLAKPDIFVFQQILTSFCTGIFSRPDEPLLFLSVFLYAVLFVIGLFKCVWKRESLSLRLAFDRKKLFLIIFFFLPIILSVLISFFKPILYEGKRYIILVLPLFYIMVANGVSKISVKKSVVVLSLIMLLSFWWDYKLHSHRQKRVWKRTAGLVEKYSKLGDALYSTDYTKGRILNYYGIGRAERVEVDDVMLFKKTFRPYKRIWFISIVDKSSAETILNRFAKEISSKVFFNDRGDLTKVVLFECKDL